MKPEPLPYASSFPVRSLGRYWMMPTTELEAASTTSGMEANICIWSRLCTFSSIWGRSSEASGSAVGRGVDSTIVAVGRDILGVGSGVISGGSVACWVGPTACAGWLMTAWTRMMRK